MKAPRDYSADDLAQFIKLVQDGGEVAIGLINRIQTAKSLVMISHQDLVCAVAALKIPNMRYRQRVFAKSGMTKCGDLYTYELGWIFVTPEFRGRGLSTKLVRAGLTCAEGKSLFATTRSDNEPMQRVLKKQLATPLKLNILTST